MTALTQDIKTDKVGVPAVPPPALLALPVEANTILYGGGMVASNSSGRAVPPTSSSALMLWGACDRQVNNLSTNTPFGAAGAQNVQIRTGVFYFANDGTVSASMIGQPVYALDDETVTTNPAKTGVTYWLPFAGVIMPPGVGDFGFTPTDSTKIPVYVGFPACTGMLLHATIDIPLATIQAKTSGTAFNIGPALPSNARLVRSDVNVVATVTGGSISAVTSTIQNTGETAGAIQASHSVFTATGTFDNIGSNPQPDRGGQQLQMTLTATGDTLANATTGHLQVNLYYTILQ